MASSERYEDFYARRRKSLKPDTFGCAEAPTQEELLVATSAVSLHEYIVGVFFATDFFS